MPNRLPSRNKPEFVTRTILPDHSSDQRHLDPPIRQRDDLVKLKSRLTEELGAAAEQGHLPSWAFALQHLSKLGVQITEILI